MLMFECVREVCGSQEKCGNQRFQKRQFANVTSFRTDERGWGLKTVEDIKKGKLEKPLPVYGLFLYIIWYIYIFQEYVETCLFT